jgi:hypothetical protein
MSAQMARRLLASARYQPLNIGYFHARGDLQQYGDTLYQQAFQ